MRTAMARQLLSHDEILARLADWEIFYAEVFGIDTNFASAHIPHQVQDFERLLIRERSVTPESVLSKCREFMRVGNPFTGDLNRIVENHPPKTDRAVWLRDRIESDIELSDISAQILAENGVVSITFEDRILFEIKYFLETGDHLDHHSINLCAGSRMSFGYAPYVYWNIDRLRIGCCLLADHGPRIRSRQVIV